MRFREPATETQLCAGYSRQSGPIPKYEKCKERVCSETILILMGRYVEAYMPRRHSDRQVNSQVTLHRHLEGFLWEGGVKASEVGYGSHIIDQDLDRAQWQKDVLAKRTADHWLALDLAFALHTAAQKFWLRFSEACACRAAPLCPAFDHTTTVPQSCPTGVLSGNQCLSTQWILIDSFSLQLHCSHRRIWVSRSPGGTGSLHHS